MNAAQRSDRAGMWAACLYLVPGLGSVASDQLSPHGMVAYLATFLVTSPFSVPLSAVGLEPDFSSLTMSLLLVFATAVLVYRITAFVARWVGR
jgi:hypothetical protein